MHSTVALEAPPTPADTMVQAALRPAVPWRQLLVIVACGLLLRGLVMAAIWQNGGSPLIGDEGNYILSALPLSEGRGIPDLWLWIRAPGFIGFAAAIFALTGGSLLALNLAQVVLSGVLVLLAFFLGRYTTNDPVAGRRAGLWAAALVALNPLLILSDNFFLSETLYLLWLLLLVLALVRYAAIARVDAAHGWRWLIAAGVIAGL